jgi:hypothetical protein
MFSKWTALQRFLVLLSIISIGSILVRFNSEDDTPTYRQIGVLELSIETTNNTRVATTARVHVRKIPRFRTKCEMPRGNMLSVYYFCNVLNETIATLLYHFTIILIVYEQSTYTHRHFRNLLYLNHIESFECLKWLVKLCFCIFTSSNLGIYITYMLQWFVSAVTYTIQKYFEQTVL